MIRRKIQREIEGDDRFWTSNAAPVAYLVQNEVTFRLKIKLIYEEPPFERPTSIERPLGGTPRVAA